MQKQLIPTRKKCPEATGCKEPYALMELPSYQRITQVYLDPMHTVTNVVNTQVELLSGPGARSSMESIISQELSFIRANCRLPPPVEETKSMAMQLTLW